MRADRGLPDSLDDAGRLRQAIASNDLARVEKLLTSKSALRQVSIDDVPLQAQAHSGTLLDVSAARVRRDVPDTISLLNSLLLPDHFVVSPPRAFANHPSWLAQRGRGFPRGLLR